MATAPVKSQPLHNFSLPHLKWAQKNHHRFSRRDSPDFDPENDDTITNPQPTRADKTLSRTPVKPFLFTSCSSRQSHQQQNQKDEKDDVVGEGEGEVKPWNLRPRKVGTLLTASFKKVEKLQDESGCSSRVRVPVGEVGGLGQGGHCYGSERQRKVVEEKRKLWISLSKEEIEEDVYSLTGSRPSRRPKKRPRNIQKQLDNVFPGLYLVGMTGESYRGLDARR